MPRVVRIVFTGLAFVGFSAFGALISWVLMPACGIASADPDERVRMRRALLRRGCRIYLGVLEAAGLFRFDWPQADKMPVSGRPAVVVANHPTLIDILVILAMVPDVSFLAKAAWFDSPFIGRLLTLGDHIPGPKVEGERSPMDGALVLAGMLDRLQRGSSVVIFPEGTRSPPRSLRAFKKGAFEAAMRAGVPVLPLLLQVDPPTLMRDQPWYAVPDRRVVFRVVPLEVVWPEQFPGSARELAQCTRARYEHALGLDAEPAMAVASSIRV